ncbi:MAG: tRNA (guanosine(37)-N1)-methyltransferase TrmD [Corynebacterium sp.]|nr:tRNA (guanosine(37)-N1)-methyltransferase TrmD [Corynebacterium sp.]
MRIDVITIFPEYLDPLRHALLGKAIEQNILDVHVHDLRDWASDVHQSVDDTPCGGGPGMVMKPTVWGPALDDVATGAATGQELESAVPHRTTPSPHDAEPGNNSGELPLLLVPTPAGKPFTQADAQAWSKEEHIVFACGRYEGIDQRVIDDARNRYRVQEVSIGDYVLIGGEVAVLVIAEAVVRLIPGVLGNKRSHQEDSFSDGLLEGPSYTRPRVWRNLEVPEVLFSGNHKKIARWRRDQALRRTKTVRPELLEHIDLSKEDTMVLDQRPISTDLNILVTPAEWQKIMANLATYLATRDYHVTTIHAEEINLSCEPDNMLVTEYQQTQGRPPVSEALHRIIIHGETSLSLVAATKAVSESLPAGTYWYGTSVEGTRDPEVNAFCAWQS